MKKIANEVKVGVVALLTLVVFFWLFNFLKGKDYFKRTTNYYAIYDAIGGLAESSPVEINGYKVGVVQSISFTDPTSGRLLVNFSVSKKFKLPKNTVAEITAVSILAGMKVQFVYGEGPGYYSFGDTIPGRLAASPLAQLEAEFIPVEGKITSLLTVLDSVITSVNEILDAEFKKNLSGTIDHLNNTTGSLQRVIGSKEVELKTTLDNITRFSTMLSENSEKMNSTFSNLKSITDTLVSSDIYTSMLNLKSSLEKASALLEGLNKGKGSAGQFLTNDSLYTNLSGSLESLNVLLKDVKTNPKRYVHFSLFGKKNISPK